MPAETQDQDERRENAGRALKTQTFRGGNKRQIWSQKWASFCKCKLNSTLHFRNGSQNHKGERWPNLSLKQFKIMCIQIEQSVCTTQRPERQGEVSDKHSQAAPITSETSCELQA